jgi:hypothetical protein
VSHEQDDLLARELGKVGSLGGKIGGGTAGALGGSLAPAKEGLIKQRSAEKAVSRVVEFIRSIG